MRMARRAVALGALWAVMVFGGLAAATPATASSGPEPGASPQVTVPCPDCTGGGTASCDFFQDLWAQSGYVYSDAGVDCNKVNREYVVYTMYPDLDETRPGGEPSAGPRVGNNLEAAERMKCSSGDGYTLDGDAWTNYQRSGQFRQFLFLQIGPC